MLSLRRTAMIGGALSAMASILVGAFVLLSSIEDNVLERFDRALSDRHTQLVVALSYTAAEPENLRTMIFDPRYSTPFSGRYWQVNAPDGTVYTSGSMFGENLRVPQQTRRSLLLAFVLVALLGLAGAILQTTTILRPLDKLRRDVAQRWEQDENLTVEDYPEEVAPLVADINNLLDRNRDIISRARRQAADLAHALKTPTAILRNELEALSAHGQDMDAATDALGRVDAQLGRSLARMRAANSGASAAARTDLSNSVNRFTRLFSSMAERDGKQMATTCDADLMIRMDQQDIEEVMGNMLDNALKWCNSRISLTARSWDQGVELVIEDDGPGIPEGRERDALRSGGRLDSPKPGTGLGLAIAIDLLQAYGAELNLEKSDDLGGLAVRIFIPSGMSSASRQSLPKAA